ncbi:NUDIX domain-containing protein [Hymenobacter guriensis]|uniref:NUDIX domain-containing protein n=1 Tax=Hymenobacter guriensis TaxID=2793065 RepID=A0ABS0KXN9_9BACT|nr:NUDIX domain-containing protein [Hymenobacter guriensis]MBG8552638.1 NUDIX domain-containing protein [Hymenobacter guriensis]
MGGSCQAGKQQGQKAFHRRQGKEHDRPYWPLLCRPAGNLNRCPTSPQKAGAGIRRETEEETGYRVRNVTKVLEAYMSPGSVTEILYFFVAEYAEELRVHAGGGVEHDQESIEVLELPFAEALQMVQTGAIKDAKTILLLQYAQLNNLLG